VGSKLAHPCCTITIVTEAGDWGNHFALLHEFRTADCDRFRQLGDEHQEEVRRVLAKTASKISSSVEKLLPFPSCSKILSMGNVSPDSITQEPGARRLNVMDFYVVCLLRNLV
jgi:hypothetical protein